MIDTLNQILNENLLTFNSSDDFYFLQILQRRKDQPSNIKKLNTNNRVIKNYYINSIEYLIIRYEEIKTLCSIFNARAMLRLNKRSYKKIAFKTLQQISANLINDDYPYVRKAYNKTIGQNHNDNNKKWIVDIDNTNLNSNSTTHIEELIYNINYKCQPYDNNNKIITTLPTKSGTHLITSPFNKKEFKDIGYTNIDIHKDNPINLYIPDMV